MQTNRFELNDSQVLHIINCLDRIGNSLDRIADKLENRKNVSNNIADKFCEELTKYLENSY